MKILIAEDVYNISVDIRQILNEAGYKVIKITDSGEDAIKVAALKSPDLVLMDTTLKEGVSGIEAASMIYSKLNIPVIFLTSSIHEKEASEISDSGAYGVVIKPFKTSTLKAAIEIALQKHGNFKTGKENSHIFVRTEYRHHRVDLQNILYVESLKDYVKIHTKNNVITTHSTTKRIEKALPDSEFIRIHRSYIVRIDKIHSIRYPDLMIEGKMTVLPIGGNYKRKLFTRLNTL